MADNSKKVSELPTASNVASTDRILVLRDPAGNPSVRTITASNLANSIVTLLPGIVPNTTIISNTVTIASKNLTPVAFFTFTGRAVDLKIHAIDTTSGDTTTGVIYCVYSNESIEANTLVSVAEIGYNKIKFDDVPTVSGSEAVTLYFTRQSDSTANVRIKYAATYY
jgi:hypothetical protein